MTHGSLFSGIGGFDLAAEWMGWDNLFHCEWSEFNQHVLKYYWPNAISYEDITKTDFTIWRGRVDVLTGGFPCQPYSQAGKRKGKEDERHLWPEMLRAIREIAPTWVVGENVLGLTNWNGGLVFEEVQADLEAAGYEVQPYILPAAGVGAPHQRYRVWFVAYANTNGCTKRTPRTSYKTYKFRGYHNLQQKEWRVEAKQHIRCCNVLQPATDTLRQQSERLGFKQQELSQQEQGQFRGSSRKICDNDWSEFPAQPPVCNGDDGLSTQLDGITFPKWRNESIKAGGNAIVPQVVFQIFKSIEQYHVLQHNQRKRQPATSLYR